MTHPRKKKKFGHLPLLQFLLNSLEVDSTTKPKLEDEKTFHSIYNIFEIRRSAHVFDAKKHVPGDDFDGFL
jgi:hypothetical protein